jgi:Protein of unknown function (DUF3489)
MTNAISKPKSERSRTTHAMEATSASESVDSAQSATPPSKRAQLIALLERADGATLDQMIALTGWQPHTTRAALTGLRKTGHAITTTKTNGVRTYYAARQDKLH